MALVPRQPVELPQPWGVALGLEWQCGAEFREVADSAWAAIGDDPFAAVLLERANLIVRILVRAEWRRGRSRRALNNSVASMSQESR